MLADTHCHLNFERFDADRDSVLARAQEAGVDRMLNPGIDLPSSREAARLALAHAPVFAAVGIHPNDAAALSDDWEAELRALAAAPGVVAIGEIGLDDYWERTPRAQQAEVLRRQLDLAAELQLPVVIHTRNRSETDRRAIGDALDILSAWQAGLADAGSPLAERPGVLHSFSGDQEEAERALAAHFYLGITGPVTFHKKAETLRQVAGRAPLERLLIETDAPFLTPHPYRGRRNEPAFVVYVAQTLAELHGLPLELVAAATTANAERLFGW